MAHRFTGRSLPLNDGRVTNPPLPVNKAWPGSVAGQRGRARNTNKWGKYPLCPGAAQEF